MAVLQNKTDKNYRLYDDLSWAWPIISPLDHYLEETELFCNIIKKHSKTTVRTLLHLGCGGGHNDYTFKKYYHVTGIDKSVSMLKLAKKLNSDVNYLCEDMRRLRLGRSFDAVAAVDSMA